MDINEEERAKGKTVECGRAQFQTKKAKTGEFESGFEKGG